MRITIGSSFGKHLRLPCADPEDLLYAAKVSIWVRCLMVVAVLVEINYRVDYGSISHILNLSYVLTIGAIYGYTLLQVHRTQVVTPLRLGIMSLIDVVVVSFSISLSGGFNSPYLPIYYIVVVMFAWVFISPGLSFVWTSMVAVVYTTLSVTVYPGMSMVEHDVKHLLYRILAMYAVGAAVSFIAGYERKRRRRGIEREQELQRQRIEISQTIHNTTAQSAYMIGLGLETAKELAGESNEELSAKLHATAELSKSAMWELRHPIDGGQIFEGKELGRVLKAHAESFTAITSVPAELVQKGTEPPLSPITRSLLFSIAHNALTNAFRHSHAGNVCIELDFQKEGLRMSLTDDGIGLPHNYDVRGHGFRNMAADTERLDGSLNVATGTDGRGTTVICVVPYDSDRGGQ